MLRCRPEGSTQIACLRALFLFTAVYNMYRNLVEQPKPPGRAAQNIFESRFPGGGGQATGVTGLPDLNRFSTAWCKRLTSKSTSVPPASKCSMTVRPRA